MNEYPNMEIHELEEGRRYLSTRVGSGQELMILTTPISDEPLEVHEDILDRKVKALQDAKEIYEV